MSAVPQFAAPARFAVDYVAGRPQALLEDPGILAVFGFGHPAPTRPGARPSLSGPLEPPRDGAPCEAWRVTGPVRSGRDSDIAWSSNGKLAFGVIEVDERAHAGDGDPTGVI